MNCLLTLLETGQRGLWATPFLQASPSIVAVVGCGKLPDSGGYVIPDVLMIPENLSGLPWKAPAPTGHVNAISAISARFIVGGAPRPALSTPSNPLPHPRIAELRMLVGLSLDPTLPFAVPSNERSHILRDSLRRRRVPRNGIYQAHDHLLKLVDLGTEHI
jgi:hypothetical protein